MGYNLGRTFPGRSKYGAHRTVYNDVTYASKKESDYAAELDLRLRAGELASWERQIGMPLTVNGILIAHYVIDFVEIDKKGNMTYVEVKGYPTEVYKLKAKLFKALYPDVKYVVV